MPDITGWCIIIGIATVAYGLLRMWLDGRNPPDDTSDRP